MRAVAVLALCSVLSGCTMMYVDNRVNRPKHGNGKLALALAGTLAVGATVGALALPYTGPEEDRDERVGWAFGGALMLYAVDVVIGGSYGIYATCIRDEDC